MKRLTVRPYTIGVRDSPAVSEQSCIICNTDAAKAAGMRPGMEAGKAAGKRWFEHRSKLGLKIGHGCGLTAGYLRCFAKQNSSWNHTIPFVSCGSTLVQNFSRTRLPSVPQAEISFLIHIHIKCEQFFRIANLKLYVCDVCRRQTRR